MKRATYALFLLFPLLTIAASAQENTFYQIGIAGQQDSKDRSPELFVRTVVLQDRVQILADARQRNEDLVQYPIQFDFFINRKLFTSQIRSPELPGPIGVDIGPDIATPPFNYLIVAKTLTPNGRPFTTALPGAIFARNLLSTLDCTVLLGGENGDEYLKNTASSNQTGNNSFSFSFEAESLTGSDSLSVTTTLNLESEGTVTGTATTTPGGGLASTVAVSGEATFESDASQQLSSLSVASESGQLQIRCS